MSQLFQPLARDGELTYLDDVVAPTGFLAGVPVDNGVLAVDSVSAIDHYHMGLPLTAQGRVAVALAGTVTAYGSGVAPLDAAGRIVIGPELAKVFNGGVPYEAQTNESVNVFRSEFGVDPATSRRTYFDFIIDGTRAYAALGVDGFGIYDISDPTSVSELGTASIGNGFSYRNVLLIGGDIYTCSRFGVGDDLVGGGSIERWDITNPAAPSLVDSWTRSNIPPAVDTDWSRYSSMSYDGAHIYVSGQIQDAFKFDPASLSTGPLDEEGGTGNWETQGNAVQGNYVHFANYLYGMRVLDKATMGDTFDQVLARYTSGGDALFPWECVANGNYLYVSTHTSGASPNRGLLVIDVTDPTVSYSWDAFVGYPLEDNAQVTPSGDNADTGIYYFNNRVYIAHGARGFLMFDVTTPLSPTYLGLVGNFMDGDVAFGIAAFQSGGNTYIIYGSGMQDLNEGTRNLYVDKVIV